MPSFPSFDPEADESFFDQLGDEQVVGSSGLSDSVAGLSINDVAPQDYHRSPESNGIVVDNIYQQPLNTRLFSPQEKDVAPHVPESQAGLQTHEVTLPREQGYQVSSGLPNSFQPVTNYSSPQQRSQEFQPVSKFVPARISPYQPHSFSQKPSSVVPAARPKQAPPVHQQGYQDNSGSPQLATQAPPDYQPGYQNVPSPQETTPVYQPGYQNIPQETKQAPPVYQQGYENISQETPVYQLQASRVYQQGISGGRLATPEQKTLAPGYQQEYQNEAPGYQQDYQNAGVKRVASAPLNHYQPEYGPPSGNRPRSSGPGANGTSGGSWNQQAVNTGFATPGAGFSTPGAGFATPDQGTRPESGGWNQQQQYDTPNAGPPVPAINGWGQQSLHGSTTGFGTESGNQQIDQEYPGWYFDPQANEYKKIPQGNEYNQIPQANQYKQVPQANQYKQVPQSNQYKQVPQANDYNRIPQANDYNQILQADPRYNVHVPRVATEYKQNAYVQPQPQYQPPQYQLQAQFQSSHKELPPRNQHEARTSTAGRLSYAVCFGFGGSVFVVKPKDPYSMEEDGRFPVYQLNQLASDNFGRFTGPLIGSTSMKDVLKWVDEKIANGFEEPGCTDGASLHLLWGLLKIACQHYGNLRSTTGKQDDGPEAALAKLLSPERDDMWSFGSRCLLPTPSEQQLQVTAADVKKFLIAGKPRDALQIARQGQLWGPALLLARQLGEKDYSDTVTDMARRHFQPGFPLQTLSLLYAGQQQVVFDENVNNADQPTEAVQGMLEQWQENLAIMAANRTNGDEAVITRLGDWLWRYRNQVVAAHICYLIAKDFDPSRLSLIGADHSTYPRTFAHSVAIQRTEVYEYARVGGNSQFILLPFQPYKLIYASMLAEAGRTNEALRYCQAVVKMLKTAGHGADVCKESATALEERLRIHSQAGSSSIVKRLLGNIHFPKVMGGSSRDSHTDTNSRPVSASGRSSTSLSPLEPIGGTNTPFQKSVSEPDFRPPQAQAQKLQKGPSALTSIVQKAIGFLRPTVKEAKLGEENVFRYDEALKRWVDSSDPTGGASEPLLPPPPPRAFTQTQNVTGPGPTPSNYAAENSFMAPNRPPGSFTAPVQNVPGGPISNFPGSSSSVIPPTSTPASTSYPVTPERPHTTTGGPLPPMPPNQYSARARTTLKSRYVDTFNKNPAASPVKPVLPPARQRHAPPAKFFVPAVPGTSIPEAVDEGTKTTAEIGNSQDSGIQMPTISTPEVPQTGTFYSNQLVTPPPMTAAAATLEVAAVAEVSTSISTTEESSTEYVPPPPSASASASFADDMQEVEL